MKHHSMNACTDLQGTANVQPSGHMAPHIQIFEAAIETEQIVIALENLIVELTGCDSEEKQHPPLPTAPPYTEAMALVPEKLLAVRNDAIDRIRHIRDLIL